MSCELNSIQDVLDWLNDPANQFTSNIFIVRWDGYTPRISTFRLKELNNPDDLGLAKIILVEHQRRKRRPDEEQQETEQ